MPNPVFIVLLIVGAAYLVKIEALPMNSTMPCPTYCKDLNCTMGLGCKTCGDAPGSGPTFKFYGGTYIGYICLLTCPFPYTRVGQYCLPTPKRPGYP